MASLLRLEKINILLKEELSKIIDRELEFPEGIIVTITRVVSSQDLHYATVLISIFGADHKLPLAILQKNVYNIQQILNRKMRMRPVPKIRFGVDEEETRRETVEKYLAELKK